MKRFLRRLKATWATFRDFNKPVPYVRKEPELVVPITGDTVFGLIPAGVENARYPRINRGQITRTRIEENGSLSYQISDGTFTGNHWYPGHLCVTADGEARRWLVGLLEEHGYKPLKMEHIQRAIEMCVSDGLWNDLLGTTEKAGMPEETADVVSE